MCVFVYYNMYVCVCSSVCRYECMIRECTTTLTCYPWHDVSSITTTNLAISNITPNMHELHFTYGIDCLDAVAPPRPTSQLRTTAAPPTTTSEPATTAASTTTTSSSATTALLTTTSAGGLSSCIKRTLN